MLLKPGHSLCRFMLSFSKDHPLLPESEPMFVSGIVMLKIIEFDGGMS
jgi:hypothetical protein